MEVPKQIDRDRDVCELVLVATYKREQLLTRGKMNEGNGAKSRRSLTVERKVCTRRLAKRTVVSLITNVEMRDMELKSLQMDFEGKERSNHRHLVAQLDLN